MRRPRNPIRRLHPLWEARRLINLRDVLCHAGNLLYRRALRYTTLTAGIGLLGYAANLADIEGIEGLSLRQTIALPLLVGSACLIGAVLLKSIPSLISSRLMTIAQANDLNLMEDFRKAQMPDHLRALWDRVYRHEWPLRSETVRQRSRQLLLARDLLDDQGQTGSAEDRARAEFLALSRHALTQSMPLTRERYEIGVDLALLEDWRDGAYFDASDTKLAEQMDGNSVLLAARSDMPLSLRDLAHQIPLKLGRKFWFLLITRALAIEIGDGVGSLNKEFDTDAFTSQVLLWPGEEDQPWLREWPGARQAVLLRRREILHQVLGPTWQAARRMLDRMLDATLLLATELRIDYDPDYCDGRLGYGPADDLARAGVKGPDLRRLRLRADVRRRELEFFEERLRHARADLLGDEHVQSRRAVRIAFLTDTGKMHRRLRKHWREATDSTSLAPEFDDWIDQAVAQRERYSRRLTYVRLHHELARLERKGYYDLLRSLAYQQAEVPADASAARA